MIKLNDYLEKKPPKQIVFILISFFLVIYFLGVLKGVLSGEPLNDLELGQNKYVSDIYLNNLKVSLSILLMGTITGGVYSIIVMFLNGFILGKLLQYLAINNMLYIVPAGLLPHAIIEIFSLCMFSAISMFPILMLYHFLKSSAKIPCNIIIFSLKILVFSIIALFAASLLECYVSNVPL
ncbi:stage II sporulation protein M [Lachnospiraceae bacterium 54-53]